MKDILVCCGCIVAGKPVPFPPGMGAAGAYRMGGVPGQAGAADQQGWFIIHTTLIMISNRLIIYPGPYIYTHNDCIVCVVGLF